MAESVSSPWIRDYFIDIAETYGAQLYNSKASSGKKKVQLTDFLTYQDNSYVWAWISDKDYKVSVRISEHAAGTYKREHDRNVFDSRFSVVYISSYRPMFSPRPLGPNAAGNTPVSHVSLEIDCIKLLGIGGHLFGNPRDLELDENVKEWIHGLRQDGGGGNILRLRKQALAQNKIAGPSLPPSPPPFSLYAPDSQCPVTKAPEHATKPKAEQPQDLKRVYVKRWRIFEVEHCNFDVKPEEPPNLYPTPHRTPSPTPRLQQQGTPTDWSPSNRGSPIAQEKAATIGFENDEAGVQRLPSETEGRTTADTEITPVARSLQPPTPAQRTKRSSPSRSTSPDRSPPKALAWSSLPSQQLPCSSPPAPSSSLPLPSSPFSMPAEIRKNIQRRVPHPGLPATRPDPVKHDQVQILVPNSDTSGAGSSQSCSQSQHRLASHPPILPSSLTTDFKPLYASTPRTPRQRNSGSPATHVKQSAEKLEIDVLNQNSTRPSAPSAPIIDVLEVGTSDTEEEADQLQLTRSVVRKEAGFDAWTEKDMGAGVSVADNEGDHMSAEKAASAQQGTCRPTGLPAIPAIPLEHSSSLHEHDPRLPVHSGSQGSMRSLFSASLEDEPIVFSLASMLPVDRKGKDGSEQANPASVTGHDPEAWKEPCFLARKKGKGKAPAVEEQDGGRPNVKASKKRLQSSQLESPVRKRAKALGPGPEVHQVASGETNTARIPQSQDINASTSEKIHSSNRPSASPTDTTEIMATPSVALQSFKPRLANFVTDFEKIDLGKRVSIPIVDLDKDIESTLLRTGRVRTLGKGVLQDGSAYLKR